jgi:hypothetical protein
MVFPSPPRHITTHPPHPQKKKKNSRNHAPQTPCIYFICARACTHRAKTIAAEEAKLYYTEISSHSSSAVVSTHSSFDIRFMDEAGSPLEDEFLQVDVTVVEIVDFRTPADLAGDRFVLLACRLLFCWVLCGNTQH